MAQVMIPQRKQEPLMQILPIGGAVAGGIYGGPQGAMAGANAGSTAGGMLGAASQKKQNDAVASDGGSAMQRRMAQIESDPVYTLNQAKQALTAMPADVQEQYRKPIDEAYQRAIAQSRQNQQRGMA